MTPTTTMKETKICRLCGEEKPLEKFEKDKRVKSGRTNRCKACKASLNDKARTLYASLKHRAEKDEQPLEISLKDIRNIFAIFDGKCIYCGATEEETRKSHHTDHIIASSAGGRHHASNLVVACDPCNRSKQDKPFIEFYFDKGGKISDERLAILMHYIAITSEQPVEEVLRSFVDEYSERTNKSKIIEHVKELKGAS